jgi:hypothetical protein
VQPSGVSFGSTCRLADAYGTYSTFSYDIYVNEIPLCSVPEYGGSAGTTTSPQTYVPPPVVQPTAIPYATSAPVATTAPVVPTSPPAYVQPTTAPPAPPVTQATAPPAIVQPTP